MEIIHQRVGKYFEVTLASRGSTGFSMKHRVTTEGLIEIERQATPKQIVPGNPLQRTYVVRCIQPGSVQLTFYETRVWESDGQAIIAREFLIHIEE